MKKPANTINRTTNRLRESATARLTMEQDFYRGRITERHGLAVLIPDAADRERVHRVIYEELCQGEIRAESRAHYRQIMQRLVETGAEGIILGCTEIALLARPEDAPVPVFDTTSLHARSAALWALDGEEPTVGTGTVSTTKFSGHCAGRGGQ